MTPFTGRMIEKNSNAYRVEISHVQSDLSVSELFNTTVKVLDWPISYLHLRCEEQKLTLDGATSTSPRV